MKESHLVLRDIPPPGVGNPEAKDVMGGGSDKEEEEEEIIRMPREESLPETVSWRVVVHQKVPKVRIKVDAGGLRSRFGKSRESNRDSSSMAVTRRVDAHDLCPPPSSSSCLVLHRSGRRIVEIVSRLVVLLSSLTLYL